MNRINYRVEARGELGGFTADLVEGGRILLVSALKWKGRQPRICLQQYGADIRTADPGFADWLKVLKPCAIETYIDVNPAFAVNLADQWLGAAG